MTRKPLDPRMIAVVIELLPFLPQPHESSLTPNTLPARSAMRWLRPLSRRHGSGQEYGALVLDRHRAAAAAAIPLEFATPRGTRRLTIAVETDALVVIASDDYTFAQSLVLVASLDDHPQNPIAFSIGDIGPGKRLSLGLPNAHRANLVSVILYWVAP